MINSVQIQNFKSLRDVSIDLERFTVFVGPNASGKSSILQGLDVLCRAFGAQPGDVENEITQATSRGTNGPVEMMACLADKWYRYRTRASAPKPHPRNTTPPPWGGDGLGVSPGREPSGWKQWTTEPGNSPPTGPRRPVRLGGKPIRTAPPPTAPPPSGPMSLPLSVLLRLEASKLIPSNPAPDPTVMSPDGTGLHSALANMALNDPDSWQTLQTNLRRIIPTIRRLRHTSSKPNQPPALLFDTVGADALLANQVSEGTLLVLGLLAALHAPGRPGLVLLDDLDRGLHPKAQKELITLLRGLLGTNPDLQIVATTHSPYMLDCMETNEVRITFLKEDGATVCAALSSHPKFPKWKDEMTPGEMWSLFGEKWLVEQEVTA